MCTTMLMNKIILYLVFAAVLAFCQLGGAIVGGHRIPTENIYLTPQAQYNLASHVVGLVDTTNPSIHGTCTAVLIGANTALTAAHCVSKVNPKSLFIVADDATFAVFARHTVNTIKVHPNYSSLVVVPKVATPNYDLALIQFDGVLPARFLPIKIAEGAVDRKNIWPVAAGFGYTSREKMDSGLLRFTLLKVESFIAKQNYFSADQSNGQGICMGDSGGPVMFTRGEDFVLMGITSAAASYNPYVAGTLAKNTCAGTSIFNNVLFYKIWIESSLAKLSKTD